MASTDRAFRALGRDEPDTLLALLDTLRPDLLRPDLKASRRPPDPRDGRLDTPDPSLEADLVYQCGDCLLLHLEGQSYGESLFADRVLRYHLGLALRHWQSEVETVALWLVKPAPEQRFELLRKGKISVLVTQVVLPEERASRLLADVRTACFAPACDDEGAGDEVLCGEVVKVLAGASTSLRRWQMAAVAARAASAARYRAMVKAMEQQGVRSVIIEDLITIGEEMGLEKGLERGLATGLAKGLEKGLEQGREQGLASMRSSVRAVLQARGLSLSATQGDRLVACSDLATLERWHLQALVAVSVDDALR